MNSERVVKLMGTNDPVEAEIVQDLLRQAGIKVWQTQEALGSTSLFPVRVGPLSEISILVPEESVKRANEVLDRFRKELPNDSDTE